MLCDSVAVVVRTRPQAIPLAMITMRKSTHGFPFLSHMSSAMISARRIALLMLQIDLQYFRHLLQTSHIHKKQPNVETPPLILKCKFPDELINEC